MKRTGILTYYYKSKNIGGLLQSYALPVLLNDNGYQAEQICFDYDIFGKKAKKARFKLFINKHPLYKIPFILIKKICLYLVRKTFIKYQNRKINSIVQKQNKVFEEFENFIPHSAQEYNTVNIQNANENYDTFITGSDQVFATYLIPLSAYYGEFTAPDKKVISYAASSDVKQFSPSAEKLFVQKLARLNAVSVREKTLKDYIEKITDKHPQVVLDPTFLLSPQEWLKIANQEVVPNKKYIFCYFLGGKSAWQRKMARAYADKYGYKVIHLPYIMRSIRPSDKYLKGQGLYHVGPREFIALINKAECVFTDSFHGLAFAINFGKNFYVFDRDDESGPRSMNARILDTLSMFNLTKCHITDKNAVLPSTPLDFTKAHKILEQEKQKSMNWLLNALKGQK